MKCLFLSHTLLLISAASILIAISVAGYTVSKSVKWTFYNEAIYYGYGYILYMYAYQNLWTSYDIWKTGDNLYIQVFLPAEFRDDSWRLIPRILIIASVVIGALSAGILLLGSLVPICNQKLVVLNSCRIASSVLSLCAGGLLVSSLIIYQNKYQSILTSLFDDPANQFPDKENISVGFYLTAFASAMFFASSVLNIANVIIDTKASHASVQPTTVSVAGYTVAKSVKWTFYNEAIDYGYGTILYIYAYQNVWTSYDIWKEGDQVYTKVFVPTKFRDDSWRLILRILIIAAVVIGALSAVILLLGSFVPICNRQLVVLNSCRIASSVLSFCAGGLLVSSLIYYKKHYQSILSRLFDDPANQYPDEENISVGFYLTAFASAMFFASAFFNIENVIIDTKARQASVQPTSGKHDV